MARMQNTATLKIEFQKGNDETRRKVLAFGIVDTPPANEWLDLLEEQMCHPQYTGPEFRITSTNFANKETCSEELHNLVKHINQNYKDIGFELPPWDHPMSGTIEEQIDRLNRLHEAFHEQEDRQEREGKVVSKIVDKIEGKREKLVFSRTVQQLNVKVHQLEECLYAGDKPKHHSYAVTYTGGIPHHKKRRTEIPDDWREYFTDDPSDQECYLTASYSTIGKDLYTCAQNNDVELVKNGMVSPKLDISAEFIINMAERMNSQHKGFNDRHQMKQTYDMVKWVIDNDLMEYVDLREKKHFYPSLCVLGFLQGQVTREEFDTLVSQWTVRRLILDRTKTDA